MSSAHPLRAALDSSIPSLKRAALDHISKTVKGLSHGEAVKALGVDRRTYSRWRELYPEIRELSRDGRKK